MGTKESTRAVPATRLSRGKGFCLGGQNELPIAGTGTPFRCPFCGCKDVRVRLEDDSDATRKLIFASVQCQTCLAIGPRSSTGSVDDLIEADRVKGHEQQALIYYAVLRACTNWNDRRRPS